MPAYTRLDPLPERASCSQVCVSLGSILSQRVGTAVSNASVELLGAEVRGYRLAFLAGGASRGR